MLDEINDSKGRYFMWLCITTLLVAGLSTLLFTKATSEEEKILTRVMVSFICAYPIGTLPLGWMAKRRIMDKLLNRPSWYVPLPRLGTKTENINNPLMSIVKLQIYLVAVCINIVLLCFYVVASMVIGIFFTPYFIISGIVFLAKGRYRM